MLAFLCSTGIVLIAGPSGGGAGLPAPLELFGDPSSSVGNPLAFDVPVVSDDPLAGRQTSFRMVFTASAGLFIGPPPTVGRAGTGADVELGDALDPGGDPAGWQIELIDGGIGSASLAFRVTALPAAGPVGEGSVVRVAAYSLRLAQLGDDLDQAGKPLAIHVGFDDGNGGEIQTDEIQLLKTVVGLHIQAPDATRRVEESEGARFYRSAVIEIAPTGYCAGFPDGAGVAATGNCTQDDTFQLDSAEDLVVVELRGAALEPILDARGAAITLNTASDCGPTTELDAVTGPFVQPTPGDPEAVLSFVPAETLTEAGALAFGVCIVTDAKLVNEEELSIEVAIDFASPLLRVAEPTESTLTLLPAPYRDNDYDDGGYDDVGSNLDDGAYPDGYPGYGELMLFGEPTIELAGGAFLFIVLVAGAQLRERRRASRAEHSSRR